MNRSSSVRKRALALTAMLVPMLPGAILAQTTAAAATDKVWDVGDRRQLFIDHRFIAESFNADLCLHQATKTGEMNIKPDKPWEVGGVGPYSSVLKDGDTYMMWYHVMSSVQWDVDKEAGAICLARSKDGITWEKPNLGVTEFQGSKGEQHCPGAGCRRDQDRPGRRHGLH